MILPVAAMGINSDIDIFLEVIVIVYAHTVEREESGVRLTDAHAPGNEITVC